MSLLTNLVAYYKLDETGTGNATDSVGGFTLVNNGPWTYAAAKINNGFDGGAANSTKYGKYAGNLGLDMSTNFTYNFWINMTTDPPNGGAANQLLRWEDETTANKKGQVGIQYYQSGGVKSLQMQRIDTGATSTQTINTTLTTSTWFMFTYRWDGSNIITYINASSAAANVASTQVGTNVAPSGDGTAFWVGADPVNSRYTSGLIDEVGVWSRSLSDAEVTSLYNSGSGSQYPFGISATSFDAMLIGHFA